MKDTPVDIAPAGPVTLPEARIGRGWEGAVLFVATLLLLGFGLVTLYSASGFLAQRENLPDWYYVARQTAGAAVGVALLVGLVRVPYRAWSALAWPLLAVGVALLVVVILPGTEAVAPQINGARRWLVLAGVSVQPSEFAKIAVVVWTARTAARKATHFHSLSRGLGPFLVVWAIVLVPILLEPNLSTACLIALLGGLVVFAAGGRIAHFAALGLLSLPFLESQLDVSFRAQRVLAFLDPSADPAGAGYQVRQSLVAIGSGGFWGVGFGEGRQKYGFLPEAHNDFIFASVGEEWGLLGVTFLVALYTTIVVVGLRIARHAPDEFGYLLAIGLTAMVGGTALLHMAVGLGLIPPTGLALPLVSYGRSNQLATLAAVGMLMGVARAAEPNAAPPSARDKGAGHA
jgi:cell division protein FtsW